MNGLVCKREGEDVTYAVLAIKVVSLLAIGVEFAGFGEDGEFAVAGGG